MFKKSARLNTSDFKEVFNFGKNARTQFCIIKYKKNNKTYSRFSVVVPKKVSKKAVVRNHLKRRFYSALKEVSPTLPVFDYVFILNSETKDIQYKDLLLALPNIKF